MHSWYARKYQPSICQKCCTCMLKKILTKLTALKNTFRIINILLLRARFYVAKKLKRVFKSQTSPFHSNESSSSQFWPVNTEIREKQSSIQYYRLRGVATFSRNVNSISCVKSMRQRSAGHLTWLQKPIMR